MANPSQPLLKAVGFSYDRVQNVGDVHVRAGEPGVVWVRLECPPAARGQMRAAVECKLTGVAVHAVRGAGRWAEIGLAVDVRRSGAAGFVVTLVGGKRPLRGEGQLVIARPTPCVLPMQAPLGGSSTAVCPLTESLWESKRFVARFEDLGQTEFAVTANRGVVQAGAKYLPFSIVFTPSSRRSVESLLLVDLGDSEILVQLCGSISV